MSRTPEPGRRFAATSAAENLRAELAARLVLQAERIAADAEPDRAEARERLRASVVAVLQEHAEALRAPMEEMLTDHVRALEEEADRLAAMVEERRAQAEAHFEASLERAGAEAERRVRDQGEILTARVEQALAEAEALAEQLTALASAIGAQRGPPTGRSGVGQAVAARRGTGPPLEANQATLDDLRGLGLSQTQAGRVLEHRDALDGFASLKQLDEVPGISRELRTKLKRALTIRGSGRVVEAGATNLTPMAPGRRGRRAGARR